MTPEASAPPFPWDEVLAAAFGLLRWPPDAVWRSTPRELALALLPRTGSPAPRLADLHALMRAYPDGGA